MDKSIKIVFTAIAIYIVLAIQFYFEKNILIIPYMFNPLTLLLVGLLITFQSTKFSNYNNNLIYLAGIAIYFLTSERTLSIFYNYTSNNFFTTIIQNPFLRLINILGYGLPILLIIIKSIKNNKNQLISLVFFLISLTAGLLPANLNLIYIISFSIFVISFLFLNKSTKFTAINYQLLLFIILENTFFVLVNYH